MISDNDSITAIFDLYKHEIIIFILVSILIFIYLYFFKKNIVYDETLFQNMKIYYINLDRSEDRKQSLESICSSQNIVSERITAIDGKKLDINDKKYEKAIHKIKWWFEKNNLSNIGHFGCYLSHMKTYETFLQSNSEYCLILEDDIELLTNDLKSEIIKNMNNLPEDWNILLLGYEIDARKKNVKNGNKNTKLKNGLLNITYFVGLHAYIINRKTAKILLENLQTLDWILDWNICYLAEKNIVNVYGVYPPIVCQPAIHMIDVNDIYYKYTCSNNFKTLTNK
jgi:glycosyl transferase family 25